MSSLLTKFTIICILIFNSIKAFARLADEAEVWFPAKRADCDKQYGDKTVKESADVIINGVGKRLCQ